MDLFRVYLHVYIYIYIKKISDDDDDDDDDDNLDYNPLVLISGDWWRLSSYLSPI